MVYGKYDRVSRVFGTKAIYRRKGNSGTRGAQVGPSRGQGVDRAWGSSGGCGAPVGLLLAQSLFPYKNNSRKFTVDSEKVPRLAFLKQKTTENRN